MRKLRCYRRVFNAVFLPALVAFAFAVPTLRADETPADGSNADGSNAAELGPAPTGLLVDLLEKTDVVWRDGFPTQLTLADLSTAIERTQIAEIRSSKPSFAWIVPASRPNAAQTAWRIQLTTDPAAFDAEKADADASPFVWDSGKVDATDSTGIEYGGAEPLNGATIYYWRVKIWDETGAESAWSAPKAFKTAEKLEEFGTSRYPLVQKSARPVESKPLDARTIFFDFGRAAYGRLKVDIESFGSNRVALVRLGERTKDGAVDRRPAGSTRYWEYRLPLLPGRQTYSLKTRVDKRNTTGDAVLIPDYIGEVMPFRYAEVEILPADSTQTAQPVQTAGRTLVVDAREPVVLDACRESVAYPFDDSASYFRCDNDDLNKIWDFCRYSIEATTALGIYIDGDRERIPYEGDALLNQLSHYSVDREYSLARLSQEYTIYRPTWPTEWILQSVQMAWFDYLYTGDSRYVRRYYDDLRAKTLVALAEENGLISTTKGKLTRDVLDSIHFAPNGTIRDIVDWPHKGFAGNENADSGETDGFVFNDFNAVVNAYHFFALNSAKRFAEILGKTDDAAFFAAQIDKARAAYQAVFFDPERGVYRDGDATEHASLHGNMFPLAFGLVPPEHIDSVARFVESRGMKCSVYGAQFLLDATYEGENGEYGLERLLADDLRGWLNMLRVGSTISLEAWDDRYKPNQDWNHAWGAAPANVIPRKLVGVEPTSPGCATLRIKPQIADLRDVAAVVPTIRGAVELKIAQTAENGVDAYRLAVAIPGNVRADVFLPAVSDADELLADGANAADRFPGIVREGKFWRIPNVGAGTWNFERRAK